MKSKSNDKQDTILHALSTEQQPDSSKKSARLLLRTLSAQEKKKGSKSAAVSKSDEKQLKQDMMLHASSTGQQSSVCKKSARSLLRTLSAAKDETNAKQNNTIKDTVLHASSTGEYYAGSKKSGRSLARTFPALLTPSKPAGNIDEITAKEPLSVQAAANALSVTARWGLNWQQLLNRQTSSNKCSLTETTVNHVTESRNQETKKDRNNMKLHESLDARVLRDALVNRTNNGEYITACDRSIQPLGVTDLSGVSAGASSKRDLSHKHHPDVPALDLENDSGSRRSSMKLVLFSFFCML